MNKIGAYWLILYTHFGWWRQRKYYHNSVETLVIGEWWKIQETHDFKWLIYRKSFKAKLFFFFIKLKPDNSEKSFEIYEQVYDTYIKYMGFGDKQKELIRLKKKLHGLICSKIETRDRNKNNWIRITKSLIQKIENKIAQDSGVSNEEAVQMLEDDRPKDIDIWNTTVLKFMSHVKYYTEKKKREIANLEKQSA